MALKAKEEAREKEIQKLIKQGTSVSEKWRKDLNTVRGHASVFANVIQKEYERRGRPETFVLDRIKVVYDYLPERLVYIKDGKLELNTWFRRCLIEYGWQVRLWNGLFEVTKIL